MLVTPVERRQFHADGTAGDSHGAHPQHPDGAEDNTHFQVAGALTVARLVAQSLVDHGVVRGSWFTRLEREIDPRAELYWPSERPIDDARILRVGPGRDHTTVQDAVDAVPPGSGQRTIIAVEPGEHRAVVHVPCGVERLTLVGLGERPEDTVLVLNNANGGRSGRLSVRTWRHMPMHHAVA
ncbi:hypothetical protein [Nesterenkonia suensis]